jgi:hypothetical protein
LIPSKKGISIWYSPNTSSVIPTHFMTNVSMCICGRSFMWSTCSFFSPRAFTIKKMYLLSTPSYKTKALFLVLSPRHTQSNPKIASLSLTLLRALSLLLQPPSIFSIYLLGNTLSNYTLSNCTLSNYKLKRISFSSFEAYKHCT